MLIVDFELSTELLRRLHCPVQLNTRVQLHDHHASHFIDRYLPEVWAGRKNLRMTCRPVRQTALLQQRMPPGKVDSLHVLSFVSALGFIFEEGKAHGRERQELPPSAATPAELRGRLSARQPYNCLLPQTPRRLRSLHLYRLSHR